MPRTQRRFRRRITKRCTTCREPGHNSRTCWLKNVSFDLNQTDLNLIDLFPVAQPTINTQNENCPVCMEKLNGDKNISITKCNHKFCSECLIKSARIKNDCPLCRQKLTSDEVAPQPEFTNEEVNSIIEDNDYYHETIQSLQDIFGQRHTIQNVFNGPSIRI